MASRFYGFLTSQHTPPQWGLWSADRVGRFIQVRVATQIELHPCHVVPAAVFPGGTAVKADVGEPEGWVEAVAGVIGQSDAGEGLPAATFGECAPQVHIQRGSCATAVLVGVNVDAGFSRPLEAGQALQRLPVGKADDLAVALQD